MRKCIFVALSLFLCCHFFLGQMHQGEMDSAFMPTESPHHNPEFISDVCINNDAWKNQGGIHCALGSTNKSYFRREVPNSVGENLSSSCFITVWKGERANLQILVWSSDSIEQVRLIKHDLIHNDGIHSISKEHISYELVRYVLSNYPYAEKQAVCGDSPYKNGFLMPDRFEDFDRFDLSPKTTRPIWIMINVPIDDSLSVFLKENTFDEVKISKDVKGENELLSQLSDILEDE